MRRTTLGSMRPEPVLVTPPDLPRRAKASSARTRSRKLRSVRLPAVAAFFLVSCFVSLGSFEQVASAAGNPTLNALIIPDPEAGWVNLSSVETNQFAQEIETEFTSRAPSDNNYTSAADGWQSPKGADNALLAIFLVQAIGGNISMSPSSVASNFCSGATNESPGSAPPIPHVPQSAVVDCAGNGIKAVFGTAIRGSILEVVASVGSHPLSAANIKNVVALQLTAIPQSTTSSAPGGSNTVSIVVIVVAIVIVGAIAGYLVFVRRRRSIGSSAHDHPAQHEPGEELQPPIESSKSGNDGHRTVAQEMEVRAPVVVVEPETVPAVAGSGPSATATTTGAPPDPTSSDMPPAVPALGDTPGGADPGWYADGDDTSKLRYWDGDRFTQSRTWNGSDWVDA